jgi:hypothetical protein
MFADLPLFNSLGSPTVAADLANAALDEYLETCSKIYGLRDDEGDWIFGPDIAEGDTHQACVFDLEEIKPKKCEHEPVTEIKNHTTVFKGLLGLSYFQEWTCSKCKAKLKINWQEVEP